MTNLSNTDKQNLAALCKAPSTEFKGTGRAMRKLVESGFVTRSVSGRVFLYTITEKGRLAAI